MRASSHTRNDIYREKNDAEMNVWMTFFFPLMISPINDTLSRAQSALSDDRYGQSEVGAKISHSLIPPEFH